MVDVGAVIERIKSARVAVSIGGGIRIRRRSTGDYVVTRTSPAEGDKKTRTEIVGAYQLIEDAAIIAMAERVKARLRKDRI